MNVIKRVVPVGIMLLMLLPASALASCEIVIEYNWTVVGPGGHYGVLQYQTGPGPFDARTAVLLGPQSFQIPMPLFVVLAACVVAVLSAFVLYLRGVGSGPGTANEHAGGDGGTALQLQVESPCPAAPQHGR